MEAGRDLFSLRKVGTEVPLGIEPESNFTWRTRSKEFVVVTEDELG